MKNACRKGVCTLALVNVCERDLCWQWDARWDFLVHGTLTFKRTEALVNAAHLHTHTHQISDIHCTFFIATEHPSACSVFRAVCFCSGRARRKPHYRKFPLPHFLLLSIFSGQDPILADTEGAPNQWRRAPTPPHSILSNGSRSQQRLLLFLSSRHVLAAPVCGDLERRTREPVDMCNLRGGGGCPVRGVCLCMCCFYVRCPHKEQNIWLVLQSGDIWLLLMRKMRCVCVREIERKRERE